MKGGDSHRPYLIKAQDTIRVSLNNFDILFSLQD
jgi:hypothetical protein